MDGMLSQEEINALLNGVSNEADSTPAEETTEPESSSAVSNDMDASEVLSDIERDAIGEISNISMGTAATTLSSLVNQKVNISVPVVSLANWSDLVSSYDRPCVFLQIQYREGLDGNNILILKERDVRIIADLMMGGDGTNIEGDIGELHLSAICEAMNQMMGSASTSLSSMFNMKIDISPPTASLIDLNETLDEESIAEFLKNDFVKNSFKMTIGDLVDSEMMQLFPVDFARFLCKVVTGEESNTAQGAETEQTPEPVQTPEPAQAPQPANDMAYQQQMNMQTPPPVGQPQPMGQVPPAQDPQMQQMGYQQMGYQQMPYQGMPYQVPPMGYQQMPYQGMPYQQPMTEAPEINVQPAQFQAFNGDMDIAGQKENINLIMDVPLNVTVELGRTSKSIQEILEFSPGTIIELDKIAGEPVDVLVNGKFVAKGEVVVIEESFGVRITEIIK